MTAPTLPELPSRLGPPASEPYLSHAVIISEIATGPTPVLVEEPNRLREISISRIVKVPTFLHVGDSVRINTHIPTRYTLTYQHKHWTAELSILKA